MLITFSCTNCQQTLEVGVETVGAQVECPVCRAVLIVPRKELGPGVTISGFQIQQLLGAGGMGQVYLARQLSLDREIALKILPAQMGLRPEAVQRFLSEVKLLARLEHPNIVTAFEAGEDAGILFLAMAYVRGESLAAKLKRTGPLPEAEALPLIEKVASALGYAWGQHQLLHRDIKPDNILIDTHGEPKLVDLGIAKSLTSATSVTVSGMVMGTPNYMSPEQAQGLT
ncbi:MAG: serine/threonine-protein kinase, partial [Verrucomicrobiota bacterium]